MKTTQYIIISVVCLTIAILYLSIKNINFDKENLKSNITIKTIVVESGFGYEIMKNNSILIKQENIPVVKGKQFFCTEKDARTIAEIVKNKIETKESPSISYEELLKSKISLNCPQTNKK